jgi:nucleotide-binding universal stress UspA family protein
MLSSLINLREDLQSSIALRFADRLALLTDMILRPVYVEDASDKFQSGTGWVRRSWLQGIEESGRDEIARLLKTEKVRCRVLSPLIIVGDPEKELLYHLNRDEYSLYIEGYLNVSNKEAFKKRVTSKLYSESPCPVLMVKNITSPSDILLLIDESSRPERIIFRLFTIFGKIKDGLDITLMRYVYKEQDKVSFGPMEKEDRDALELLEGAGYVGAESLVVQGPPEHVAEYIRDHGLVAAEMPARHTPRMELLALASNPLLLCR